MTEPIDRVAVAIRKAIGTRHSGLPRGGWDGLMKMAATAAIEAMRNIDLSEEEIGDLLQAIHDAQGELCCGPGFPEANAIDERWERLKNKLLYVGLRAPGQAAQDPR